MKVIIDGVFNHCGSFNKWMDREHIYSSSDDVYECGAYEKYESPYHSFFKFYGNQWPDNCSYDGWWGHDTLPKLNYEESKELENYILDIGKNGYQSLIMLMAGDLMLQRILDIAKSIIMSSGESSERLLRKPIQKL